MANNAYPKGGAVDGGGLYLDIALRAHVILGVCKSGTGILLAMAHALTPAIYTLMVLIDRLIELRWVINRKI